MSKTDLLRWIGNILLIIGYQTMLWGEFKYGLMIKVVGGLLTVPFAIKLKLWDVLFLCAMYSIKQKQLIILFLLQSRFLAIP